MNIKLWDNESVCDAVIDLIIVGHSDILVLLAKQDSGEVCCPATVLIMLQIFLHKIILSYLYNFNKGRTEKFNGN